ncbi:MAG: HU family DNA-binding protein [Bacteroides sp.]|nr:HU family DNA-binding protein [Bacteroides sp.]
MPLVFKPFRSNIPNKEGQKLYYPRLVKMGKVVGTQRLGELIAEKSSATAGDVHNVVRNLMSVMRDQLQNGRSVRLDGLGTFTLIAHANGKGVETEDEVSSSQIQRVRCRFSAEYTRSAGSTATRALLEGIEYVKLSDLVKTSSGSADNSGDGGDDNSGTGGGDDNGGFIDPAA